MLTHLRAVEFLQKAPTGKTEPAFLLCENDQGEDVSVVAKLAIKSERGPTGLAMEVLVACLAGDLNLPIPEPFILELEQDWIDAIRPVNAQWALAAESGPPAAFASKRLPDGFTTWIPGSSITASTAEVAAGILLLDAIMKNADRRPENPNCLRRGEAIYIFDHELCFPQFLLGIGNAWTMGGLQALSTPGWHIFRDALHGKDIDWTMAIHNWGCLTDAMIDDYVAAIPAAWQTDLPTIQAAIDRIKEARDNIADCTTEVQRVLKC